MFLGSNCTTKTHHYRGAKASHLRTSPLIQLVHGRWLGIAVARGDSLDVVKAIRLGEEQLREKSKSHTAFSEGIRKNSRDSAYYWRLHHEANRQ